MGLRTNSPRTKARQGIRARAPKQDKEIGAQRSWQGKESWGQGLRQRRGFIYKNQGKDKNYRRNMYLRRWGGGRGGKVELYIFVDNSAIDILRIN